MQRQLPDHAPGARHAGLRDTLRAVTFKHAPPARSVPDAPRTATVLTDSEPPAEQVFQFPQPWGWGYPM